MIFLWWRTYRQLVLGASILFLLGLSAGIFVFMEPPLLPLRRGEDSRPSVIVGGVLDTRQIPEGTHVLAVRARTPSGLLGTARVSVVVTHATAADRGENPPVPPPTEGQDEPTTTPAEYDPAFGSVLRPKSSGVTREAEDAPRLVGDVRFSGVVTDGDRGVVVLAKPTAQALYYLNVVPQPQVLLELRVRHDAPPPVDVVVSLNGRSWKRLVLEKGDGKYRTHRVGLLRNFSGGVIGIRFLNDQYDAGAMSVCGDDAACKDRSDRNLYIDWLRLVPIE